MPDGRPLRILLAAFVADSRRTGMGRWSHEMADALGRLGHAPTLWFADDFPRTARLGRLAVLLAPVAFDRRVRRERARFDAVVVHEPAGFWLTRRRGGPPVVLMCHNVEAKVFRQLVAFTARGCAAVGVGSRLKTPVLRLWQSRGAIRRAEHVVCLSSEDVGEVRRAGRAPGDITRITNGAPPPPPGAPGSRDRRHVLFVGGWVDVKGRRVLPRLWRAVRRTLPATRLTLVGTGAAPEALRAAFAAEDRDSLDIEAERADAARMARLMAGHRVLVLPSLSEGSPLTVLEAMAAGLPVAASRAGGVPDLIRDGTEGLLFAPCDPDAGAAAVCRLLAEPTLGEALAMRARERVRTFTWDAAARDLVGAIRKVT